MRFDFLLSEVLSGLRRNVTMTVAMILTTAISIGLFGGGLLVLRLAENSKQIYLERVQSQVFLDSDISANDPTCDGQACRQLLDAIDARADVASVQFFSREQNYEELIRQLPTFADSVTESSVQATMMVRLTDPESDAFAADVAQLPGVESITNQLDLVDRLFAILDGLRNVAFAVALVQAVGAILLIANMIQVSAFTRRTEVGIMRLVGASRWYTQLPFLLEAMLAALVGVVIAIVGLVAVRAWFFDDVLQQFYEQNVIAPVDYGDILYISPYLAVTGLSIAAVTAYVTLRLYVRR